MLVLYHCLLSSSIANKRQMGGGQDTKAWSIIGSLSRTVEYLQLTIEPDEIQGHPLLRPRILLQKADSSIELEERRRVFWNIFLLDR